MTTTALFRPARRVHRGTIVIVCAVALAVTGCGGDDDPDDAATATPTPAASTSEPSPSDSATEDPTADPTETDADGELPGEPWVGFAQDGDVLVVIGVQHDDVLNVRAQPGTDAAIMATAGPTADDLVATGRGRQLPSSFWYEVTVDDATGWASSRHLAFQGPVDDVTSAYLADHDRPSAETMVQLGEIIADDYASQDPPSTVVQSVAPTVGDLGEIVVDVVGLGDDSVRGVRLHVFATPDEGGEGFTLRTIEMWTFCDRGVTDDTGICV